MDLKDLVGIHKLTGVDHTTPKQFGKGTNAIRFELGGVIYAAVEDEDDGYRSRMRELVIDTEPMTNTFQPVDVLASLSSDREVLTLRDVKTGGTVLEVGTDQADDYYPCFVSHFAPEQMSINQ